MKKYLIGLCALILAIGLNAFTTISENKTKATTTPLHWFEYDAGTGQVGAYLDYDERSEFLIFGCQSTSGDDCRRGYPVTALIDSGDPGQGVSDPDAQLDQIQKGE